MTIIHKGWHSRGYLPHFDQPGLVQMLTINLWDSLPREKLKGIKAKTTSNNHARKRKQIEDILDCGSGACHLRNPQIANIVEQTLLYFDGQRYNLLAWVVMPNHVHILIETIPGFQLGRIVHSWKSFSANQPNKILDREGEFWQLDYFDRFIRDLPHLENATNYIHYNPVKAKLVDDVEDWPFSSARLYNM